MLTQTGSYGGSCVGVDRFSNEVILHDASHSFTGSDTKCITLTYSYGAIPAGNYVSDIYSGGTLPIKTELWHMRPGGPGEITNLRMSISPDGPPSTEFPAGTQTVWAGFDYVGMEETEVGMIVASDVPIAIWTTNAGETSIINNNVLSNGTITRPPPTPRSPAIVPEKLPRII